MTVSQLQQTIGELARVFASAGAAKQDRELREFTAALEGFSGLTLAQFVKLAEQGRKPAAPPRVPRAAKVRPDAGALQAEVREMYLRPTDPAVTEERIRSVADTLGGLTKNELVTIAESIDIHGAKSKRAIKDVVTAILHQLLDRRGSAARRGMADRPADPPVSAPAF